MQIIDNAVSVYVVCKNRKQGKTPTNDLFAKKKTCHYIKKLVTKLTEMCSVLK